MPSTWSLSELTAMLAGLDAQLAGARDQQAALTALTGLALRKVPAAQYAGITRNRNGSWATLAPTDKVVEEIDQLQYRLQKGPCVDAIQHDTRFNVTDLTTDERWPDFSRPAAEATGVRSMLGFRILLEDQPDVEAALNLYSREPSAFDEADEAVGLLLATAGALALSGAQAREHAENLERALTNSRTIGVAIGVLMSQHKINRESAFDLLRLASQNTNRKLADLAAVVEETGALPDLPVARRPQGAS